MPDALTPLALHLVDLWAELDRQGATVHRVRLDAPAQVLAARIAHEEKRLRALAERWVS